MKYARNMIKYADNMQLYASHMQVYANNMQDICKKYAIMQTALVKHAKICSEKMQKYADLYAIYA